MVEIVSMFEKELLASFVDFSIHFLINLGDEVELDRVVSCHWMFFLDRYMKKLNMFV